MTRARNLGKLANTNTLSADNTNNFVGIGSTQPDARLDVDGTVLVGTAITIGGASGIVSATAFYGDGSNLDGVASAGLGTALAEEGAGSVIYYTDAVLGIGSTVIVSVPSTTSDVAYTQYATVSVDGDADLIVAEDDDFVADILGIGSDVQTPGTLTSNSRVRAARLVNSAGTGAPQLQFGAEVPVGYGITGAGGINVGGALTAASGNFTGAVTVGGVLTYDDVTNVDSIGIITARNDINIKNATPTLNLIDTDGSTTASLSANSGNIFYDTSSTNRDHVFQGASSEVARITGDGKVGIGSAIPQQLLDIASTAPNIRFTDTVDGHSEIDGNAASLKFNADKGNTKADTTITFHVDNSEKLRLDSSGNLLIGGTPASSPNIRLNAAGTASFNSESQHGDFNIDSNGELQIGQTFDVSANDARGVYVSSGAVGGFGGIRVQSTNSATSVGQFFAAYRGSTLVFNVSTGGNLSCTGSFSKGSGSFKIDHPLKSETHHLVHSFVEGPQADNIYRGKVDLVDGTAAVNIDTVAGMTEGTFAALNREIQCFTTNETGWTAIKGSVSGNVLTITAQENTCTDTISWLVIGERKDQHMYDTEWTDENGKVIVEPTK